MKLRITLSSDEIREYYFMVIGLTKGRKNLLLWARQKILLERKVKVVSNKRHQVY